MAEIQNNVPRKQKGVKRLIKKATRVDLTPMVDLGFLLITFFVFTTKLSEPKVMPLVETKDDEASLVCESCTLTVMLEKNGLINYYEGMNGEGTALQQTSISPDGIRKILQEKRQKVARLRGNPDAMVVIIKPSKASSLGNYVDMMDEVAIAGIKRSYTGEMEPADKLLLARNGYKE